ESRKAPKDDEVPLWRASSPSSASSKPDNSSTMAEKTSSPIGASTPATTASASPASVSWLAVIRAAAMRRTIGPSTTGDHLRSSRESIAVPFAPSLRDGGGPVAPDRGQRFVLVHLDRRRLHV